jgi:hypothetical protein
MQKEKVKTKQNDRLRFLADRMALLLCELTNRDVDFGPWCFEDFYNDKAADKMRESKTYEVNIDFVRFMLRKHDGLEPNTTNTTGPERARLPGGSG